MSVQINTNAGTGPQEVINTKRAIAGVDGAVTDLTGKVDDLIDSVEQIESELAVKRGHWHLFGEYDVHADDTVTVEFGRIVSKFAVIVPAGGEFFVDGVAVDSDTDYRYAIFSDGLYYVEGGYPVPEQRIRAVPIIENGGYSSFQMYSEFDEYTAVKVYVID